MKMRPSLQFIVPVLVSLSLLLASCAAPVQAPTVESQEPSQPEVIVETVIVKEEVEVLITPTPPPAAEVTYLRFYFPVGVAGALAPKMEALVNKFNSEHPNIQVEPIFSGGYPETFQKALTAHTAGNPPDVALLTDADVWSMKDAGAIISLDDYVAAAGGQDYLDGFYETFIQDVTFDGKMWGMPFQKSTPIFYWNKDMFEEAGLDPEKPPETWDELLEYAKQLTIKDDSGNVTRWGVEIPIDTWLLSAFAFQNGAKAIGDGTEVYIDTPEMTGALQFLVDLANTHQVMPQKRLFGDSSADFVAGQTAMLYNSTGSLTFIRESATFDFGAAFHPGNVQKAVPTGGGPLVIFSGIPKNQQDAAWTFVQWMVEPAQGAQWQLDTGYIAVSKAAIEEPALAEYIAGFTQAKVAIDQLQYAIPQPPRTHDGRKVFEIITTALEDAMFLRGEPADLLKQAQADAEAVLAKYK